MLFPCRQHCSTPLVIKILLMLLTGPDNPFSFSLLLLLSEVVLWQWNVYHWKHSILLLLRTRGRNQWLTFPLSEKKIRLMAVSPGSQSQGTSLDWFTSYLFPSVAGNPAMSWLQPLNPTQHWSRWRPWGRPNSSPGVPGGHHALTCLGILSSKGCHASTCLGIC